MSLPPCGSATNVTDQIRQSHLIYGGSDHMHPAGLSASKSLIFANGASIQRPIQEKVTVVPYTLHYQGTVGLFGAENCFVKVHLDLRDYSGGCYEEPYWECAKITRGDFTYPFYEQAEIDLSKDLETVNTYEPANINNSILLHRPSARVSVDLTNLGTGNIYNDDWLDVRLYTKDREEHAFDRLYCGLVDDFYIGFHARNTRRLDYNVKVHIGDVIAPYWEIPKDQRRFFPVGHQSNIGCANTDLYRW